MSVVRSVEAFPARFKRDVPYLGSHDVPEGGVYFTRPHIRAVYSKYFETTFVKVTADDGTVGWGECLAPVAPRVAAAIVEDLLAPTVVGSSPLATTATRSRLYDLMRDRGYTGGFYIDAITAVDIALWDLKGRLLGVSVAALLGGPVRTRVPSYVSAIGGVEDHEKAKRVEEWLAKGHHHFKHHGGRGAEADFATMKVIRGAAEPDSRVGLDAHWVYSPAEAEMLGRRLEEIGVSFLEAPMDPENVAAHARLAANLSIPVAVGECIRTRYEYRPWLEGGAADILQPDVGRSGISETVALATMAEPYSVPVAPHLSVGLGPMVAASIQVAAAIPNLYLLEYQPPTVELANSLLDVGIEVEGDTYILADRPGLGIEVSESAIRTRQA